MTAVKGRDDRQINHPFTSLHLRHLERWSCPNKHRGICWLSFNGDVLVPGDEWFCHKNLFIPQLHGSRKQNRALSSDEQQRLFRASHQMTLSIKEAEKIRKLRALPVDLWCHRLVSLHQSVTQRSTCRRRRRPTFFIFFLAQIKIFILFKLTCFYVL